MTTKPAKLKPPSDEMGALSLSGEGVRADELEAFRREWRAEVAKSKVMAVDAGGVRWKGAAPDEPKDMPKENAKEKSKLKEDEGKGKGKGKGKEHGAESGDEAWPEPTSPIAVRPRSPTTRSPTKPLSPTKAQLRSPTKTPRSPTKLVRPSAAPPPKEVEAGSADSDSDTMPFPQRRRTGDAVGLYTRAVEAEQGGRLSDALHLYRKAFRADDNVDRLYALKQRKAEAALPAVGAPAPETEVATPSPADIVDPTAPELPEYKFTREVQVSPDYERVVGHVSRLTALLEKRVGVFEDDEDKPDTKRDPAETFRPADAQLPLPLASLPSELVDRILSFLDVSGVERFAQTCWRARLLTATCGAWRRLGERIYRPPMGEIPAAALVKRHMGEWRTTIVEEERVRMDGAYIAVCHYIRPGAGEQWVTITHMITYHRFLRFYPDGHVISFLTTDHPSEVVPLLKPALRAKGLHFGRWRLIRAEDERGRKRPRVLVTELLEPGVDPKYEFEMELSLRETGRGRWNKLDLVSYSSINLATGESLGLSLKHQKPFYFSKVRSYNPPF